MTSVCALTSCHATFMQVLDDLKSQYWPTYGLPKLICATAGDLPLFLIHLGAQW